MRRHLSGTSSEEIKCQFYIGPEPFWAWVCSVSDPQDSIKELMNCVSAPSWLAGGCLLAPVQVSLLVD